MSKGRISNTEYQMRVHAVLEYVLAGARTAEITAFVIQKWGTSRATAFRYLAEARTELAPVLSERRDQLLAEHIGSRRAVRRQAAAVKDLRTWLDVLRDEAKLLGLYPAEKVEMRIEDLDAAIERELARLAPGGETADADAVAPAAVH